MKSVAFIQIGRYGDIANILPLMHQRHAAGERVFCYVHADFATIFDGIGYVTPIICTGSHTDVRGAYDRAIADGHDEVIASQVNGAFTPALQVRNYTLEQWIRAGGKLGDYQRLPLIFDKAPAALPRIEKLPRIGLSLNGFSSAFARGNEFKAWLLSIASGIEIVDLDARQPRAVDLLPIIDSCDLLIAIDSFPLHLGYAVGIPTIALQCDAGPDGNRNCASWYRSEPRPHWVASLTYDESLSPAGKARIAALLDSTMPTPATPIVHVVNWYEPTTGDELSRMNRAKATWKQLELNGENWRTIRASADRNSRDGIGDTRCLPFVRDMLDAAATEAGDGIIVVTNSDSLLSAGTARIVRERCTPCCFSRRVDIKLDGTEISGYRGVDLFACQASWWREHRGEYPDMLHGTECWDGIMWMWFADHHPAVEIDPPLVKHVLHEPFWSKPANLKNNIGQRWNRAQATLWMIANGKQNMFNDGEGLIK